MNDNQSLRITGVLILAFLIILFLCTLAIHFYELGVIWAAILVMIPTLILTYYFILAIIYIAEHIKK